MSFLVSSPYSTLQTRSKAIYTLSGLLKHNAPAVKELGSSDVEGWARLRDSLQGSILSACLPLIRPSSHLVDPDITVRRKTLFLLNTLLLPTSAPDAPSNFHTPDSAPSTEAQQNPIYPNSHAAHLHNPLRASTSRLTLDAFKEHGITGAVVDALTNPLPCGEDGEDEEGDMEVEENGVRFVLFFSCTCLVVPI